MSEIDSEAADRFAYDSREPLRCCAFPGLNRQIGVLASKPFHHRGLNAEYVDVSRETIHVNSKTFGNCYPVGEAAAKKRAATVATIADLDEVITELTVHRDRLRAELETNLADAAALASQTQAGDQE